MTTFGVIQFPGSCDERDALGACERVGAARLVWHEETDLSELEPGERLSIPVKHAWGRYFAPPEELAELRERGQIALRYARGQNPNGSLEDIAGVTNEAGNVLGLMPHPEHAVDRLTGSADGRR